MFDNWNLHVLFLVKLADYLGMRYLLDQAPLKRGENIINPYPHFSPSVFFDSFVKFFYETFTGKANLIFFHNFYDL